MPVVLPFPFERISEEEFHTLDYEVMAEIFRVHREFGPQLFWERVYRNAVAQGCTERGIDLASTEVPLRVTFGEFSKTYFADLVVNRSAVYEVKAAEAIHPSHERQTLNYLLLADLAHGKVVNMGARSVDFRFVSTNLNPDLRRRVDFECSDWLDVDVDSRWFRELMQELISDWGAFLELPLYYDAVTFFRGGRDHLIRPVEIVRGNRVVATQPVYVLSPFTALRITALTKELTAYQRRLQHFLNMTNLRILQWVNFNRHQIVFRTLKRH